MWAGGRWVPTRVRPLSLREGAGPRFCEAASPRSKGTCFPTAPRLHGWGPDQTEGGAPSLTPLARSTRGVSALRQPPQVPTPLSTVRGLARPPCSIRDTNERWMERKLASQIRRLCPDPEPERGRVGARPCGARRCSPRHLPRGPATQTRGREGRSPAGHWPSRVTCSGLDEPPEACPRGSREGGAQAPLIQVPPRASLNLPVDPGGDGPRGAEAAKTREQRVLGAELIS